MKTRYKILIIGIVFIISIICIVILDHYISVEREFERNNTSGQLKIIIASCNCQADPESRCPEPFFDWENSTHYIDNNLCEYITLEEYYDMRNEN